MISYINDVTVYLDNKERNTIFVPDDNTIVVAFTVKLLFGKMYVLLVRFDGEEKT